MLKRVVAARDAAAQRWERLGRRTNASVTGSHLRDRQLRPPAGTARRLAEAVDRGTLSARGFDRVLRIAWSICDLDGRGRPDEGDVDEALFLRGVAR